MVDVLIAIPSFRRPKSLERLLRGIEKLNTRANVAVLVADNDAERREAVQTCDAVRTRGYRWPIEAIVVRERGIANVRNALVGHALRLHDREFIAMLDDDEEPDTKWLDELLRVQAETGADALNGSTKRVFENDPGAWAVHCDGVSDVFAPTGNIGIIEGTGNFLARRTLFAGMPAPWFDTDRTTAPTYRPAAGSRPWRDAVRSPPRRPPAARRQTAAHGRSRIWPGPRGDPPALD